VFDEIMASLSLVMPRPPSGAGPHRMTELPAMSCAVYIACDPDHEVEYVGKVRRRGKKGLASRLSHHHVPQATWETMWIVPLRENLSDQDVRQVEAVLVARLRPRQNTSKSAA
jgi:hypothetical protein